MTSMPITFFHLYHKIRTLWMSQSSGNAFVNGPGGLIGDSNLRPVKLEYGHSVPTARHRCGNYSTGALLPGRNDAEMGLQTRDTLRRNTANIRKNLI